MKKLSVVMLLVLSFSLTLVGCTKTNKTDVSDTKDTVTVNTTGNTESDSVKDLDTNSNLVTDWNEYQFEVKVSGSGDMNMDMKIYKKGNKSMMEVINMIGTPNMPFNIKKSIVIDGTGYQEIEKSGEIYRFANPMMGQDIFNLKEMSQVDKNIVTDTKTEKINGKKMTCYYIDDAVEGKGKACLYDGIFMYGSFEKDGQLGTMEISDYSKKVNDKVFKLPAKDKILSAQDMVKLFQ